jgi:hypothetical protein
MCRWEIFPGRSKKLGAMRVREGGGYRSLHVTRFELLWNSHCWVAGIS